MLRQLLACLTILTGLAAVGAPVSVVAAATHSVSADTGDRVAEQSPGIVTAVLSTADSGSSGEPAFIEGGGDEAAPRSVLIGIDRAYE